MVVGAELRDVVARRDDVLATLLDGPATKPDLESRLDHSRSTIDRAVAELLEAECIAPTDATGRAFRPTQTGRLALDAHRAYCADAETLGANASVLNAIPPDAPLARSFVTTATVHASEKAPDVALRPGTRLLSGASKLVGTAPVVFGEFFDTLVEWVREEGGAIEVVLEADLLESIRANYAEEADALLAFESVDLYVLDDAIPYALWVIHREDGADADATTPADATTRTDAATHAGAATSADAVTRAETTTHPEATNRDQTPTHAGITVYDGGGIRGTLVTEDADAVAWAIEQYRAYRDDARALEAE